MRSPPGQPFQADVKIQVKHGPDDTSCRDVIGVLIILNGTNATFSIRLWQRDQLSAMIAAGLRFVSRLGKEQIVVTDIRNADNQHAHAANGTVNDTWRNVHQRTLAYCVFDAVQHDRTLTIEHVIQLRRHLVVVLPGTIDVDRVCPRSNVTIVAANEQISPTARTAFSRRGVFMPNKNRR